MRPFDELTDEGRLRRLREVATEALERYELVAGSVRRVAIDTNTIYRVDTTDRRRFALRVGAPPTDSVVDTSVEIAWLLALTEDDTITTPRVHPNRQGDYVTIVDHPGVPEPRRCVLFDWLPGTPIGSGADLDDYRRLGQLSARLHDHGEHWTPPPDSSPLLWDRVFYYPEPIVLYDEAHKDLMTPGRTGIVRTVESKAAAELDRIAATAPRSICHGDLHPWNVMRYRGRLAVFDFEDAMVAAPVQDIAITLFYNRTRPDYGELRDAFQRGYTSLRPWPVEWDGQLELLMAARTVMFINYVIRLGLDPGSYIPMAVERIARVLQD